jgi:hypothetical protein
MKPQSRRSGLLIRELPDELVVYDQQRHRAHCLNRTAAAVFRHADGTRTVADLARLLDPDAPAPAAEEMVTLALARLAEADLLEDAVAAAPSREGLTRREVARRVGIAAAILLPAVATIVAPTPAEAAATCATDCTGKIDGTPCCGGSSSCICPNCVAPACACVSQTCVP